MATDLRSIEVSLGEVYMKYADEVDAHFGIPWPEELGYERGELVSGMGAEAAKLLLRDEPEKARFLLELLEGASKGVVSGKPEKAEKIVDA